MLKDKEFSLICKAEGIRIDKFLSDNIPDISRTRAQELISEGNVLLNGREIGSSGKRIRSGDSVSVKVPEDAVLPPADGDKVDIIFEDDNIIVVNKPHGVAVHPAGRRESNTLVEMLWSHLAGSWEASDIRPGVVHRLDKNTSGVMVLAKNTLAAERLVRQFSERSVKKVYLALVHGDIKKDKGSIKSMIGRNPEDRKKMSAKTYGRWAKTDFTVKKRYLAGRKDRLSFLEVYPLTGRTHQIRVHMSAIGCPVVGDPVYSGREIAGVRGIRRQMLHAYSVEFEYPGTKKRMKWKADLPEDFKYVISQLKAVG